MRVALPSAKDACPQGSTTNRAFVQPKRVSSYHSVLLEPTVEEIRQGFPTDDEVVTSLVQGDSRTVMLFFKSNRGMILNIFRRHKLTDPDSYLGELYINFHKRSQGFDKSKGLLRMILSFAVYDTCRAVYESRAVVRLPRSVYRHKDSPGRTYTNLQFDVVDKPNVIEELLTLRLKLNGAMQTIFDMLCNNKTQVAIARDLGYSKQYVNQCVVKIKEFLEAYGYHPSRRSNKQSKIRDSHGRSKS